MNNMKNAFYNALKTISTIIFPLITIPYISRVLSAENVGKINFSNSFVNYFMLLASLGVSTYAMRECSKVKDDKKELEKIASQIFSINVCSMVVSYIAFGIILFGATGLDNYKRIILILSINIFFSVLGADWLNMSVGDFKYIAIRTFLFQFISMLLLFMFVRSPSDYFNYAIILVISSSGGNIANIFYRRKICKVKTTSDMHINKHMKPILFLFSLLLAQTLLSNIDITILGIVSGDKAVGMYSMAVKIYTTIEKVISSIAFVLIPQVSIMFANQEYEKMSNLLTKTFGFICTFSLPMMIGLVMISKEVLLMRKTIYEEAEKYSEYIDSYISYIYEDKLEISEDDNIFIRIYKKMVNKYKPWRQSKYTSFDMVNKFNEYLCFVCPEEVVGMPGIGFVEGMACGTAYIGLDTSYYRKLGLKPGIDYITYDGTLEDLIDKIKYCQAHVEETRKIGINGREFVYKNFNQKVVAKNLFDKFNELVYREH
jgi:glycosyltransferase involved in cell wall biosynthesis